MKKFLTAIMVFLLLCPSLCFGAETRYLKSDQIRITFPDGWDVATEEGVPQGTHEKIGWTKKELQEYVAYDGEVFIAVGSVGGVDTVLDSFYWPNDFGKLDDDSDEALLKFHKDNKNELIEEYIYEWVDGSITIGKPDLWKSDFGTFIRVTVSIPEGKSDTYRDQLFYTIKGDNIIIFMAWVEDDREYKLNGKQLSAIEGIIGSFDDSGYYKTAFDDWESTDAYDNQDFSSSLFDGVGFFSGSNLIKLLIAIVLVSFIVLCFITVVCVRKMEKTAYPMEEKWEMAGDNRSRGERGSNLDDLLKSGLISKAEYKERKKNKKSSMSD